MSSPVCFPFETATCEWIHSPGTRPGGAGGGLPLLRCLPHRRLGQMGRMSSPRCSKIVLDAMDLMDSFRLGSQGLL